MSKIEELWANEKYMSLVELLNQELNKEPDPTWIKILLGTNVKYLPIERIEWLLTDIFGKFHYEVKSVAVSDGSVYCVVRVHYFNPVLDCWEWADGVGASPLVAAEKEMAMALALPAAKTFAVKDAVEPLGKIFGKDLNRADLIAYDGMKKDNTEATKKIIAAFTKYKGADKKDVGDKLMAAVKEGWTEEKIAELSKKLKVA
jgi:hypothetical protein